MSKPHHKLSYRALAEKWGASSAMQISRLANRIDFDLPDQEVAELLLKKCMKKPRAMYEAIYTLSDIPRPTRWALPEPEPDESCDDDIEIRDDLTSDERVKLVQGLLRWNDLNHSIQELYEPLTKGDMESARQLGRHEKEVEILRADLDQYFKSGI